MTLDMNTNNVYYLDMTGITGATEIKLFNENNLPTEEILTDWGDGTQNSELTHTYSTAGEYVVVSNLQNSATGGDGLRNYLTKMTVYYAKAPSNLCFNYDKITEVILTKNWAEKTIEKYGQKISITQMFRNCPLLELPNLELIKQFKPTYCLAMFYNCKKFTSIDLTGWDLSNCTAMNLMFTGCSNLTEIKGIEDWDVSKCTSFDSLFLNCSSLTSLDLSSWNVSQCTTLQNMFNGCTSLITLNLANWNTSKVRMMSSVFYNCPKLKNLDITGWDTSSVGNMESMFFNNQAGMSLDLSSFNTQKVTAMNTIFQSCIFSSLDISNWTINNTTGVNNMFNNCKVSTIGLLYASDATVNKITSLLPTVTKPTTIYYYDADPSQLTPVEGVTFKKYAFPTTIQLPPHIQLHSFPDGTRDEVDIKTGILTRNIKQIDLNGSDESWKVWPPDSNETYTTFVCSSIIRMIVTNKKTYQLKGGNLPWYVTSDTIKHDEYIRLHNYSIYMTFNNNNINSIQNLRLYLQNNPITIYEAHLEPTTEQLILNYNNSCDYGRILPTGMCDKYSVVNSMYTQTMTSILLDGANTWDAMEEFENTVKFTATGTTVGVENLNMLGAGGLYCDNDLFPNINDDSDVPHCRVDEAGNKFYIYVDKDMLMSPDLIGWQIWLQANSFNLIYELAEHLTYVKQYEELDPTQARWEGMDCMRDGAIKYHANNSDNITMYPTLEYVAPSINNFEVTMLEPNTDYTIYAEGINKNDTINLGGTDINFNNGTVYTSGDNQWLRIDNNDSFYNMVITKGDTTGEVVPYFEGMQSVQMPVLRTVGKNLFNFDDYEWKQGGLNDAGYQGATPSYSSFINVDKVPIEKIFMDINKEVYLTCKMSSSNGWVQVFFYDKNGNACGRNLNHGQQQYLPITLNVPKNAKFFRMQLATDDISSIVATYNRADCVPYVPYKSNVVSYTDLKLRSLPNGVKDTINVVTGEYVQRVGEITLKGWDDGGDGELCWRVGVASQNEGETMYFAFNGIDSLIKVNNVNSYDIFVSDSFKQGDTWRSDEECVEILSRQEQTAKIRIRLKKSRLATLDIDGFMEWLSKNPITIQYELAEPIITKLDPQILLAYTDGTINLSSDTGLLPTTHYTVPSTNTFHLSSMKTGTRYTLKYPSASGSITIGDITYKISSESMLFTTPLKINGDTSAIIFSDANPENVILLEGAYNKREVPFFTGVKSVKNPNITIIDQLSTESTSYNCETEIELRGLPNGVADKLDIIKGKLTTNVGIRPYQEGDENLPNIWTDGYETVYALSSPVVKNVTIDRPTVTTNSLIELSSDYLIPQLNYRAPSSNNFPLDLLQPNQTYTLYADTLTSGSYTLGGTKTGIYSQPHTITLGDITDNLLTFNGDLGLSNVMLVKGNSLKTSLPPYFLGIRSVTDGHLLVEGMAGEMNEITFDEGIVLRDCNGVKDTIDLITCTLTKRTGEITLTGAEGWFTIPNESVNAPDDYVVFALTLQGVDSSNKHDLICDTITSKYLYNKPHDTESIYGLNNSIRMCVKKSRIGGDNVNALKSWLNQNPTTVVYTLKTPLEVQLENTWTTTPLTSYDNQTEISSTVSTNSLKPMISVTVATTTLEEIISNLEAQNAELEEENLATMLALTEVYEMMYMSMPTTMNLSNEDLEEIEEEVEVTSMGMIYAKLIHKGLKTIDQVPYFLQREVKYALKQM